MSQGLLKAVRLNAVPYAKSRRDDDFADRLNHRATTALLTLFALIVTGSQNVGVPIDCWVPAHFDKGKEHNNLDYANSYCWIHNTYKLPLGEYVPADGETDRDSYLSYYQWVPVILLSQALLFYLPYVLWMSLSDRSGIDLQSVVEAGDSFTVTDLTEIRDKTLMYMTMQVDRYLRVHNIDGDVDRCTAYCSRRRGNYLYTLYLIIKVLYLVNVIGQLFLLDSFLGSSFHAYGAEFISGLIWHGDGWSNMTSVRFPRTTMCDLKVRRLGNVHRYTVMCVLPINLFNEKIFLFIWFWMVFLGVITLYSLIVWLSRFAYPAGRRRYVKRHLDFVRMLKTDADRRKTAKRFVHRYLGQDGVFILRLIAHNTNTVTVTEFIAALWENYKKKMGDKEEA